jgi:hypothetical protein
MGSDGVGGRLLGLLGLGGLLSRLLGLLLEVPSGVAPAYVSHNVLSSLPPWGVPELDWFGDFGGLFWGCSFLSAQEIGS